MITLPAKTHIWIAAGVTDLRRGFDGLSALVQAKLQQSPFLRSCVCVSWPTWRSDQTAVVGWRWSLLVRQAPGTWSLRVAASDGRHGGADAGAAINAAGRH